jgi:hypothetical protein
MASAERMTANITRRMVFSLIIDLLAKCRQVYFASQKHGEVFPILTKHYDDGNLAEVMPVFAFLSTLRMIFTSKDVADA